MREYFNSFDCLGCYLGSRLIAIGLLWACLLSIGFGQSISRISLTPSPVIGGNSATGTVTVSKKAGTAGIVISLSSSLTSVTVPSTVTVPAGAISANFTATTTPISANATATISAKLDSKTLSAKLAIAPAKLASITVSPTQVVGGNPAMVTVSLIGKAPAGGYIVSIGSSSSTVSVPKSITVAAGSTSATFSCKTTPVATASSGSLIALLKGVAQEAKIKVTPAVLSGLSFNPSTIAGGSTSTGTVSLNGPAASIAVQISLNSASPLVTVPASVTIAPGSQSANFTCTTQGVSKSTSVQVKATSSGTSIGMSLTLQPVDLAKVALNPASIVGGTTAAGTVTLNANAPTGGIVISLSSSLNGVTVPASITVPSGSSTAIFTATTQVVTTLQTGTITATDSLGISQSASITVIVQPGLAKSPWPKIHQGALNGGLGLGKGAKGTLAWSFTPLGYPNTGITVGPDGVCYFETVGGYQCAYNSDGTQKWVTKIASGSTQSTGPNAAIGSDGTIYVSDSTLTAYTPTGTLKWKSQYGAGGPNEQPVIGTDGTIYVGENAINPDGSLKWQFMAYGTISSPAIGPDGTIYLAGLDNKLHAINPNGTGRWAFTLGLTLSGSKPAVAADGTIYVPTGANGLGSTANIPGLFAINPDGTSKWTFSVPKRAISSATIGTDGTIYVFAYGGDLFALNPDGSTKWSANPRSGLISLSLGPDGTVYAVGADTSGLFAYSPEGVPKWQFTTGGTWLIAGQLANGNFFLVGYTNIIYGVSTSGSTTFQTELFINVTSSPVIGVDNTIYAGADDGYLYAINPDGSPKWKFATNSVINTSPAIATDGTIYVNSFDGHCFAVSSTGQLKWSVNTGPLIISSPTIGSDGTIYVASSYLYAYNPNGTVKWVIDNGHGMDSAPALGPDGTIYVEAFSQTNVELCAYNPNGTQKWTANLGTSAGWVNGANPSEDPVVGQDGTIYIKFGTNLVAFAPNGSIKWTYSLGPNGGTNPCIGPDGTIYVGANSATSIGPSSILAMNPDGTLKWQYVDSTHARQSDISVSADGTVYAQPYQAQTVEGLAQTVEAISSKGALQWVLTLPPLFGVYQPFYSCSPTIGADGTIYVGGPSLFAIK